MSNAVEIIGSYGIANADAIVRAANDAGLPLGIAVAMIDIESGGQNIYGHDDGGVMWGRGEVTQANFQNEFLPAVLAGHTSNGVGPAQITYPGYFTKNQGSPWWDPYFSMKFGFDILQAGFGSDYSWEHMSLIGSHYNAGPNSGVTDYGVNLANLACEWTDRLAGADSSSGLDLNSLADAVIRGEFGNDEDRKARLGANYDAVQAIVNTKLGVQPAPQRRHTVVPGDNLTAIANQYGVTITAIVNANGISNPDHIEVGWELIIP